MFYRSHSNAMKEEKQLHLRFAKLKLPPKPYQNDNTIHYYINMIQLDNGYYITKPINFFINDGLTPKYGKVFKNILSKTGSITHTILLNSYKYKSLQITTYQNDHLLDTVDKLINYYTIYGVHRQLDLFGYIYNNLHIKSSNIKYSDTDIDLFINHIIMWSEYIDWNNNFIINFIS